MNAISMSNRHQIDTFYVEIWSNSMKMRSFDVDSTSVLHSFLTGETHLVGTQPSLTKNQTMNPIPFISDCGDALTLVGTHSSLTIDK